MKDQLIRLGSAKPELREHIRPVLDSLRPTRHAAQYRDPKFKKLGDALELWAHRFNSKFMGEPTYADVESRGVMQGSRDHPLWIVTVTEEYDPVDPFMKHIEIQGEASDPDVLEMSLSKGYGSSPSNRTFKSKDLYDWSPRDVLALLDRWL